MLGFKDRSVTVGIYGLVVDNGQYLRLGLRSELELRVRLRLGLDTGGQNDGDLEGQCPGAIV